VHDVEADAPQRRVLESLWDGADDAKPERLPQPHGAWFDSTTEFN
jgi:hypothetical protein